MTKFLVKPEAEPANDYDKAKQDVMKAVKSIQKLPLKEQRRLAEELIGIAGVAALVNMLQDFNK